MKKLTLIAATAAAVIASFTVQAQTWTNDKAHSKLGFSITHMMISDVEGSFKNFDAKITAARPDFSDAVFELTADVNSVNTDNEKRDEHLRTPDFFDAAKFPTLSFRSTSVKKISGKNYLLSGNMTIHGVTKPVKLIAVLVGQGVHPYT